MQRGPEGQPTSSNTSATLALDEPQQHEKRSITPLARQVGGHRSSAKGTLCRWGHARSTPAVMCASEALLRSPSEIV